MWHCYGGGVASHRWATCGHVDALAAEAHHIVHAAGRGPVATPQEGGVTLLMGAATDAPLLLLLLNQAVPGLLQPFGTAISSPPDVSISGGVARLPYGIAPWKPQGQGMTKSHRKARHGRPQDRDTEKQEKPGIKARRTCSLASLLSRSACRRRRNSLPLVFGRPPCVCDLSDADVAGRAAAS
jgi:hypothetical protein